MAATSLGLFALAVAGGWLGPDVGRGAQFCEVSSGPIDQPVNTLSNLGFVVAGLAIAARAGRPGGLGTSTMARRPGLAVAFACLVVLLGPASMAMHATETELGGHLDMLSMYLVAAFAVSYAAMRRWDRGPAFLATTYVAVVAACELAGLYTAPIPVVHFAGTWPSEPSWSSRSCSSGAWPRDAAPTPTSRASTTAGSAARSARSGWPSRCGTRR